MKWIVKKGGSIMQKIKISIIIPVYGVERYLKKCLDSLINQTLDEIEIIIVNDASPDNSHLIMKEYEIEYPRKIKCIYLKENLYQGGARNKGLEIAVGEYIMFVDSDDYVDKTICEKLYNKAKKENCDIVYCDFYKEYEGKNKKLWFSYVYKQQIGIMDDKKRASFVMTEGYPFAKIIKRGLIEDNDLRFPVHMKYEDLAVGALFYLYQKKCAWVQEPLYYYNVRDESTCKKINDITHYDFKKAAEYLAKELSVRKFNIDLSEEISGIQLYGVLFTIKKLLTLFEYPDFDTIYEWSHKLLSQYPNLKENKYFYYKNDPLGMLAFELACVSLEKIKNEYKEKRLNEEHANYFGYYEEKYEKIDSLLHCFKKQNKVVGIWGAGKKGTDFLLICDKDREYIKYVLDSNKQLYDTATISGHKITCFNEVCNEIDIILVMNRFYYSGIMNQVKKQSKIQLLNLDVFLLYGIENEINSYLE